jgi:5-methylcytosine-specific restriction protein A
MGDLFDDVRASLEGMTGLGLEVTRIESAGGAFHAIRPVEVGETPSFSISLSHNAAWADATFLPDTFSGGLVRRMSEKILPAPKIWTDLVEDGVGLGVETGIWINGTKVPSESLPPDVWRDIEIDCRVKLSRGHGSLGLDDALSRAAGLCLSLLLSALDVERVGEEEAGLPEGARTQVLVNKYERNPVNRYRCIQHHGHVCWVCDFQFRSTYGLLGEDFIEVHHIVPVSQMNADYVVNPFSEMVPLCSNCHSMVHRQDPAIKPEELRRMIGLHDKGIPK